MALGRAIYFVPFFFFFSLSASIFIKKVNWAQMADTINIRDTVVMAQTGRKMSQILLTYVTQTLGPTPTISGILRDLNE